MTKRVAAYLITGFLGAGKSTFLNRLLSASEFSKSAVIVNEFGDTGIDHLLIEKADDDLLELSNGCVCCSLRGEIVDAIDRITQKDIDFLFIEASGVADPQSLISTLCALENQKSHIEFRGSITLVDGGQPPQGSHTEEYWKQIAFASIVLVSKLEGLQGDLAQQAINRLGNEIGRVNPQVPIFDLAKVSNDNLSGILNGVENVQKQNDAKLNAESQNGRSAHRFESIVVESELPIEKNFAQQFLEALSHRFGSNLLRLKGLILQSDDPDRPLIAHMVAGQPQPFNVLDTWQQSPGTQLVIIGNRMDMEEAERLFHSFWGSPQIDTPDQSALLANPLAIPGV